MRMRKRKDLRVLRGKHAVVVLAGGGLHFDPVQELWDWLALRRRSDGATMAMRWRCDGAAMALQWRCAHAAIALQARSAHAMTLQPHSHAVIAQSSCIHAAHMLQ